MATMITPDTNMMVSASVIRPDRSYVRATFGLHMIDGNDRAYWTLTGEVYEAHGTWSGATCWRNDREPDACGMITEELLRAFPWLAPVAALHLSDSDGVPMHAYANGLFWARQAVGFDAMPEFMSVQPLDALNDLWRTTLTVEDARGLLDHDGYLQAFVFGQSERWREESEQAYELLQQYV